MRHPLRAAATSVTAFLIGLVVPALSWAAPDFGAVTWRPLGCPTPDLITPASPAGASFAGDHAKLPAYFAYDTEYLYFRFRMDGDPAAAGGFAQYSWTALMQVPERDPFQYQYQLSLNGKNDTLEIWRNDTATDVTFPHFQDDSEFRLDAVPASASARAVAADTSFNGS